MRRWARPGWEKEDPTFRAATEAAILRRIEQVEPSIPAPRVVAVTDGRDAGEVPAILLTRLPGRRRPHDVPPPGKAIDRLAELLVRIHAVDQSIHEVVPRFRPYYDLARLRAPANARRPDLWARAIHRVQTEPPMHRTTFLHRDYHPGNALWSRGRLTGIVDWTGASWGPPAADLAHLRDNLGVDHEPALAERAEMAYRAAGGQAPDLRWWDLRTLLDWLPDQDDLAGDDGMERLERYLAWLLEGS
jgi:aminoglycoside phosphotransferase (APT) family kinase protein